jgi:hypothetical protein
MEWIKRNLLSAQFIQFVYSIYLFLLVYLIENYSYLLLIGIISFVLALGIKKFMIVRVINFYFCSAILLVYILYFFDFLILKGYISEITSPFFLMGITLHFPVLIFNLTIVFKDRIYYSTGHRAKG